MIVVDVMRKEEWARAINDPLFRRIAYGSGRDYVEETNGSESNACAAVFSTAMCMRGLFSEIAVNTGKASELCASLDMEKFTDWRQVQPGDACFSADDNQNGMPDHVFIATSFPTVDGYVEVFDNYGHRGYKRNLVAGGKYTPFAYGMRYEPVVTPLTGYGAALAFWAFKLMYAQAVFENLPLVVRAAVNRLRKHPVFNKLK